MTQAETPKDPKAPRAKIPKHPASLTLEPQALPPEALKTTSKNRHRLRKAAGPAGVTLSPKPWILNPEVEGLVLEASRRNLINSWL